MSGTGSELGLEAGVRSDGFSVDLGALGVARDRVGRLAAALGGGPGRDVPDGDVFGHGRLAAAVSEFAGRERGGVTWLAGEVEAIRYGLGETIKTYQRVDEDGAGHFRGIGS